MLVIATVPVDILNSVRLGIHIIILHFIFLSSLYSRSLFTSIEWFCAHRRKLTSERNKSITILHIISVNIAVISSSSWMYYMESVESAVSLMRNNHTSIIDEICADTVIRGKLAEWWDSNDGVISLVSGVGIHGPLGGCRVAERGWGLGCDINSPTAAAANPGHRGGNKAGLAKAVAPKCLGHSLKTNPKKWSVYQYVNIGNLLLRNIKVCDEMFWYHRPFSMGKKNSFPFIWSVVCGWWPKVYQSGMDTPVSFIY